MGRGGVDTQQVGAPHPSGGREGSPRRASSWPQTVRPVARTKAPSNGPSRRAGGAPTSGDRRGGARHRGGAGAQRPRGPSRGPAQLDGGVLDAVPLFFFNAKTKYFLHIYYLGMLGIFFRASEIPKISVNKRPLSKGMDVNVSRIINQGSRSPSCSHGFYFHFYCSTTSVLLLLIVYTSVSPSRTGPG